LGWLSLVNTALAFTLWNRALRTLTALEGGILANAQIVEVALMAWIVLGERLAGQKIIASLIILAGVVVVQLDQALAARRRPGLTPLKGDDRLP
jgi:drug/metabolite transporter (DMT)-like permease